MCVYQYLDPLERGEKADSRRNTIVVNSISRFYHYLLVPPSPSPSPSSSYRSVITFCCLVPHAVADLVPILPLRSYARVGSPRDGLLGVGNVHVWILRLKLLDQAAGNCLAHASTRAASVAPAQDELAQLVRATEGHLRPAGEAA